MLLSRWGIFCLFDHPPRWARGQNKNLPGKIVTVAIALNFLSIALMVDMGIFRRGVVFVYSHSMTYETQHAFPSFDLCVFLSFPC